MISTEMGKRVSMHSELVCTRGYLIRCLPAPSLSLFQHCAPFLISHSLAQLLKFLVLNTKKEIESETRYSMADQPLVSHIFTADPSAHVFEGRLYVYPSHDVATDIEDNDNGKNIFIPSTSDPQLTQI
jgi:hypothetical protein